MLTFRRIVWVTGITLTILVNIFGAIRPMYKGVQSPVGTDLVSVCVLRDEWGEKPIPVMKWNSPNPNDMNGKFVETGQEVRVSLRNTYKDDIIVSYPRLTLCILGATILLNCALGIIKPPLPSSDGAIRG